MHSSTTEWAMHRQLLHPSDIRRLDDPFQLLHQEASGPEFGLRRSDMKQKKQADRYRLLLIALVAIIYIFPFLWMFSNSFMSEKNIFSVPPKFIPDLLFTDQVLDNYKEVFTQYNFGRYTINSLWVYTWQPLARLWSAPWLDLPYP